MHYVARLSYNTSKWRTPTRDAQYLEEKGSYNQENGFGHEDWLFRDDWVIDGWRYGFVQGVNNSYKKLIEAGKPFDLTLYTIDPQKHRQYIATIKDVECLDENKNEPQEALEAFKKNRWFDTMIADIRKINGQYQALGDTKQARHILNLRFRLENVDWFPEETYATKEDPISQWNRYTLTEIKTRKSAIKAGSSQRKGSEEPPVILGFMRKAMRKVRCTPHHARMQTKLMAELKKEFPEAAIIREENFIDVMVKLSNEIHLFEIKCDLEPRAAIRQALGQILEYAYYPGKSYDAPLKLTIVGRSTLNESDRMYLERLKTAFGIPINYRFISI